MRRLTRRDFTDRQECLSCVNLAVNKPCHGLRVIGGIVEFFLRPLGFSLRFPK